MEVLRSIASNYSRFNRYSPLVGYRMAMGTAVTKHSGRPMLTKGLHRSGETLYVEMSFVVINGPQSGTLGSVATAREPRERLG